MAIDSPVPSRSIRNAKISIRELDKPRQATATRQEGAISVPAGKSADNRNSNSTKALHFATKISQSWKLRWVHYANA